MKQIISRSEKETHKIAAQVAKDLPRGGIVCLYGDLGSGKTVFARGFAAALGIREKQIKSPTYTLVREYQVDDRKKLYHFDFYRIQEPDELMVSDLQNIFGQKNCWLVIEWPDRVESVLPSHQYRINIRLEYVSDHSRRVTIQYHEQI